MKYENDSTYANFNTIFMSQEVFDRLPNPKKNVMEPTLKE